MIKIAKCLLISCIITNFCIRPGSSASHKIANQGKLEKKYREDDEKLLVEAIKGRNFDLVVSIYKESERVQFKAEKNLQIIDSSALCLAAFFEDISIVSLLLDSGLPVNSADAQGNSALMWSSALGSNELVKLLLERGADVTKLNKDGAGALEWAISTGQARIIVLLVEQHMKKDPAMKWAHLPWCMEKKYYSLIRVLIHAPFSPVKVDDADSNGDTALIWAVKQNKEDVVKLLLLEGASVEVTNRSGETPLSIALGRADHEMVYLLAKQAATKDEKNRAVHYGSLAWAARHGHIFIVRSLLKRGDVVVDALDKGGNTPLFWAVSEGHEFIAQLLLQAGAQPAKQNLQGRSPIALAAQKGDTAMLELLNRGSNVLEDKNEYGWTLLITAARYGHLDTVRTLVDQNVKIDQEDNDRSTALYWAARFGHTEIVYLLLDHGADVNKRNKYGWTPLHWPIRNKHAAVVRLLLDRGATIDVKDRGLFAAYCKGTWAFRNFFA